MKRRIRQVMPATGWMAVYKLDDGSEHREPLVAWALVTESYERHEERPAAEPSEYDLVVGMTPEQDGTVDFAEAGNLVRYECAGTDSCQLGTSEPA